MRYLITTKNNRPFFTEWFDAKNHFNADLEMTVYDLLTLKYTTDGVTWNELVIDTL